MSFPAVSSANSDQYYNCTCVLRGDSGEHMYAILPKCDISKPEELFFIVGNNTVYSPSGDAKVNVCGQQYSASEWLSKGLDKGTVLAKTPSVDVIIGWGKTLFNL